MRSVRLVVNADENGITALVFLRKRGFSQRAVADLKKSGGLTRGGEILRTIDRVYAGEEIFAAISEDGEPLEADFSVNARVVAENEDYAVFDKAAGVPVHPSLHHRTGTLGNYFAALYPDRAFRPVYRLDNNTSGLCLAAKNAAAALTLSKTAEKRYYAAVSGEITRGGEINLPIARADDSIILREVRSDGAQAVTLYEPILVKNGRTLLEITLRTGRTHQIRVHFAHIGFPLLGDELYGGDCGEISRHALHCGKLRFTEPFSGKTAEFKSPLPADIAALFGIDGKDLY